ncbi:GNAT family N-acetyltransferase [Phragmitibacter flavus]|uniref:GNAT family N-acetyltransferase n=1 Tax=Phragmitibacter flavus TaxID=2576071 RepID=A0A5R8K786_9BACT|nr:GNAT family N-acetyltransferase [Phragmitibacter flavus]TLD68228.1 GNAT family N-acetyltransferase [Phragmitibacter flavus]
MVATVYLADGAPVLIRPLVEEDREAVMEAFRRLSPDSRYYRFWSRREGVSEQLLQRFLNSEPGVHETWLAQDPERLGEPGYGGGSYWRSEEWPEAAEVSLVVADEAQHRGIGTLLLALVWVRAYQMGVREFFGFVLPDNYSVLDWFRALGATMKYEGGQYRFVLSLDPGRLKDTNSARRLVEWVGVLMEMEGLRV